jgi:hypothetical protein
MKRSLFEFYKYPLSRLLFEQEEETEPEDDEDTEDTEDTEDSAAAEDADAPEDSETADESEDTEAADDVQGPEDGPGVSLDDDIEAVLIDFEASARDIASDELAENSNLYRLLYETTDDIDIDAFAADVARLIKNYDNLLDIEQMLVDKARDFVSSKYGEDVASNMIDTLETQHDIIANNVLTPPPDTNLEVPLAVGATSSGE